MHPGALLQSLRRDPSVKDQKLTKKTLLRILGFARPHRRVITAFLIFVAIDAMLVIVNPLLVRHLIDDGILHPNLSIVIWLAVLMALVSVFDAILGVTIGYLSAHIGEGLIFDLRKRVFGHIQRMPMAFFTRTQTGALVSRLNNDVIGAQRAFTSTLSNTLSNAVSVLVVGVAMLALSWQVTVACLALFPLLLVASKWVGRRI
ncbi:MAG TPA: ABC transporter transmembrane domain-containing protein, partial [Marmoricola sp.]|nr:ABC transporter transmembrane domain-containing protein [Marmoricola sp.]